MRCVRAAVGLKHVVGVAMIGGDQQAATALLNGPDDLAEAAVDGLDAATAAGITPVCPTISALAKLMIPKAGRSSVQASTKAFAASGALICGLWS